MMNTPPTSGISAEQIDRNKHIVAATVDRNKDRDPALPKLATYQELVQVMCNRDKGSAFATWQAATQAYNESIAYTGTVGGKLSLEVRAEALHKSRLARIEYLAPLDAATANARTPGAPSLLSSEEWDMLACSKLVMGKDKDGKEKPVTELMGEERAAAVKKFKEEIYGKYENLISQDQFGRAGEEVQKSRRTFKRLSASLGDFFGFREKTGGEKALVKATKEEVEEAIKQELYASQEIKDSVEKEVKAGSTKTPEDLTKEHVEEAFKKKTPKDHTKKAEEIETTRAAIIAADVAHGKAAYRTNVSEITAEMELSLQVLTVFQHDVNEYRKTNKLGPDSDASKHEDDVKATIEATTSELEKSVLHDYHHFARLYEERFAGAGKMSRYGSHVDASRSRISDGQEKVLKEVEENKKNLDEKGNLLEGKSLTVNGVPCENVGVVDLYKLDTGFSFFGRGWGGGQRVQQVGKFMEAWMVETTAANQQAYQAANKGEKLTMAKMLEAYATGDTLPDGSPNKNKGPNGPINALRIATFPVSGGMEATLQAFAELQAFAHIAGIEINIDTAMIAQNSSDSSLANRIRIEWISHRRLDDRTYGQPAKAAIEKKYGLEGIKDPVAKRQALITALAGNDTAREKAAYSMIGNKESQQGVGIVGDKNAANKTPDVKGGGSGATPVAAASSTPAPVTDANSRLTFHTPK